jgi:hypothetical protein
MRASGESAVDKRQAAVPIEKIATRPATMAMTTGFVS